MRIHFPSPRTRRCRLSADNDASSHHKAPSVCNPSDTATVDSNIFTVLANCSLVCSHLIKGLDCCDRPHHSKRSTPCTHSSLHASLGPASTSRHALQTVCARAWCLMPRQAKMCCKTEVGREGMVVVPVCAHLHMC